MGKRVLHEQQRMDVVWGVTWLGARGGSMDAGPELLSGFKRAQHVISF